MVPAGVSVTTSASDWEKAMTKPYYFVSYSSREPHVGILLDALALVLGKHFEQHRTPGTLESATSQYERILQEIAEASFGVVILDGLRPNVLFEYGIMVGKGKPVLLFMEESAEVDVPGFFAEGPTLLMDVKRTVISVDNHFSDIKDQFRATWSKFKPKETRQIIMEEYNKKRGQISGFVEITEREWLFE